MVPSKLSDVSLASKNMNTYINYEVKMKNKTYMCASSFYLKTTSSRSSWREQKKYI